MQLPDERRLRRQRMLQVTQVISALGYTIRRPKTGCQDQWSQVTDETTIIDVPLHLSEDFLITRVQENSIPKARANKRNSGQD
jgi:hypothetical protein